MSWALGRAERRGIPSAEPSADLMGDFDAYLKSLQISASEAVTASKQALGKISNEVMPKQVTTPNRTSLPPPAHSGPGPALSRIR